MIAHVMSALTTSGYPTVHTFVSRHGWEMCSQHKLSGGRPLAGSGASCGPAQLSSGLFSGLYDVLGLSCTVLRSVIGCAQCQLINITKCFQVRVVQSAINTGVVV